MDTDWVWQNGDVLQYRSAGVKIIGGRSHGKSFLSRKLLDRDYWELVSAGVSDVRVKDGKAYAIRTSEDNLVYSRLLGGLRFPLTENKEVEIKMNIVLDDLVKPILASTPVIDLRDLVVNRDYLEAVERVESGLIEKGY